MGYTMMIFIIMSPCALIRNATFIGQMLEKSQNIKDFLEIFNTFLRTFFFKVEYLSEFSQISGVIVFR